jgi:predicted CXXCH cytochrome family protein
MRAAIVFVGVVIITGLFSGCLKTGEVLESSIATYVGSEKCGGCHRNIYEEWELTAHPYMLQEANEHTVVGDFVYNNELEAGGYTTRMSTSDGKYYVTTIGPDGEEHTYTVKYTVGGIWKQRYLTEFPDGALHFLPVQWNMETREWVDYHGLKKHQPGDGAYWSDRGRMWQVKCAGCHVTGFQMGYDPATDTITSTWVEGGAGCEACHGPGSEHVRLSVAIEGRAGRVVNPAKITNYRLAAMTCGQCHIRGSSKREAVDIPGGPDNYGYPAGYLPGANLDFYYDHKPGLWPDGTSKKHHQQYNDYTKSAHAEAGVMCWDCHDPHRKGEANRYQTRLPGDKLCQDCHTMGDATDGIHGIHSFGGCIGCHMPKVAKSAVPYDIHSHTLDIIEPGDTIEQGGLDKQPNSCNACHYHEDDRPEDLAAAMEAMKSRMKSG